MTEASESLQGRFSWGAAIRAVPRQVADFWDAFFFAAAAMPMAGIIRISYGVLTLINMLCLKPYLEVWFTEGGPIPLASAKAILDPDALMPLSWFPHTFAAVQVCYWVMIGQIALLTLGVFTRVNALGVFFWLVAFQHRNMILFDGEDVLFRLMAFYLVWLPSGAYFGFDARKDRRPVRERRFPLWRLRLLQIQMSFIYLSTLGEKIRGTDWLDGSALYYVSRLDDLFGRFPLPESVFNCLTCLQAATWGTLIVEFIIPVFLWNRRLRGPVLLLALGFHLGIDYSMNLNLFHWIMLTGLLSFVPWCWERDYRETTLAQKAARAGVPA